jgi:signal transduction histidine kinase
MVWLEQYTSRIKTNTTASFNSYQDLSYWRDDMFTNTMIFIIPVSLIALIPSLVWAIQADYHTIAFIDLLSIAMIFVISFKKGIEIENRKLLFIATIYVLSCALMYYIGLNSTLYLLVTCVLSVLIYPFKNQYFPAFINTILSCSYVLLDYFKLIEFHSNNFSINELFAVFGNLIFLSFLICFLIPQLFRGLDDSIKERILQIERIENQNKTLREITWMQSHTVRTPLSRLMALTDLLKDRDITDEEKQFLIENILISSYELDAIIKDIVVKSELNNME